MLRAPLTLAVLLGSGLAAAQALPPQALAQKAGCMACHGMVHKQVGPGFAQVAARYRAQGGGDADAPARLAGKIRNGSVGVWGRVIMPRHPQLSEAEALALARWVLSQP
nr:c-type cytochrome [uncultured Albidiferax sp.]